VNFEAALAACARAVEAELERLLPKADGAPERQLFEAMRYAALGGGKRLRPFLVVAGADLFGASKAQSVRVGAAIELVHAYSLVHDDLPCMDDDDLRRGRPTVHKRWDEATALLAGDALLTLAFEVLAHEATTADAAARSELVLGLARAAGATGMVGGQMLDLLGENAQLGEAEIVRLQRLKTGAMISFSAEAGAILGRASEADRTALKLYAHDLGLAFQIADDLLDHRGDAAQVGKKTGKDAARGKATFVALMGEAQAEARARMLAGQAASHLDPFGARAEVLRALAEFAITRKA
jgi:farnesyl diphosphate synthase